jgi:co-chaperonin GroES (HSP10)
MIRPLHDWVLVKIDPFPEERNGIVLLKDSTANTVHTALVVAHGKKAGVERGEKVAFLRWHLEHKPGQATSQALKELGEDLGLIRSADILFAFPAGEKIEVSV